MTSCPSFAPLVNPCCLTNSQLLSFSKKRVVMHAMENCHTLLGDASTRDLYQGLHQTLAEMGMSCRKKYAEKQLLTGCCSTSGVYDLGILRSPCCASLQGVCTSLPALSARHSRVTPQKAHEDGLFFCWLVCWLWFLSGWMCCHVYGLSGPSALPISRFSLQLRIKNLFLWCVFFFYTEPRFGRVTCLQVLRLPEKHQMLQELG